MSGMGDGYVGTSQDAVRIRRLEKQREAERQKIQELKTKSASSKDEPGLLQFGSSTSEVYHLGFLAHIFLALAILGFRFRSFSVSLSVWMLKNQREMIYIYISLGCLLIELFFGIGYFRSLRPRLRRRLLVWLQGKNMLRR